MISSFKCDFCVSDPAQQLWAFYKGAHISLSVTI